MNETWKTQGLEDFLRGLDSDPHGEKTTAIEMINWFWSETKRIGEMWKEDLIDPRLGWKHGEYRTDDIKNFYEYKEICTCAVWNHIKKSRDPVRMRSFMAIGILIDEIMYTHFKNIYSLFEKTFEYPECRYHHDSRGHVSPRYFFNPYDDMDYFPYAFPMYSPKIDWTRENVSDVFHVSKILLKGTHEWFVEKKIDRQEYLKFKRVITCEAGRFRDEELQITLKKIIQKYFPRIENPEAYP